VRGATCSVRRARSSVAGARGEFGKRAGTVIAPLRFLRAITGLSGLLADRWKVGHPDIPAVLTQIEHDLVARNRDVGRAEI
jgi:hypothetical protein